MGIPGNDHADAAAKTAATLEVIDTPTRVSVTKCKAVVQRNIAAIWEATVHSDVVRNPMSKSWLWYSSVRAKLKKDINLSRRVRHVVTRFKTGYRRWADVPHHHFCVCGKSVFTTPHALLSCSATDRSHLVKAVSEIPRNIRTNKERTIALMLVLQRGNWVDLVKFYDANKDIIEGR